MGCVNCSMPLENAREGRRPMARAATTIGGLVEETTRKSLRIKKENYVKIKVGSITDYYEVGEKIGEGALYSGAHGSIYRAVHRRLHQPRAIKMIAKSRWSQKVQREFVSEVDTLRRAVTPTQDHPNILKIYEVIEDAKYYHIVTEMLTGGELLDKLLSGAICSESMVAGYMQQILSAVSYCHEVSIIHRDLKPENLVFESTDEESVLKVIDFGASCGITEELKDLAGTDFYLAPEILTRSQYNEKCDVWSCGVILYVLLCGYPPFNGSSVQKIHRCILEQDLGFPCKSYLDAEWRNVSRDAKDLIRLMLRKDPSERPSAQSVLNHPWLVSIHDRSPRNSALEYTAMTNLKDFQTGTKLRRAALHLISNQIIEPEMFHEMRVIFMGLDLDRDGRLSREELRRGFELARMENPDVVDLVMAACDADRSGFIEFSEFLTATVNWPQLLDQKTIEAAFAVFDADCDGRVSSRELKSWIGGTEDSLDDEAWQEMCREAGIDMEVGVSSTQLGMLEFRRLIIRRSQSFAESQVA